MGGKGAPAMLSSMLTSHSTHKGWLQVTASNISAEKRQLSRLHNAATEQGKDQFCQHCCSNAIFTSEAPSQRPCPGRAATGSPTRTCSPCSRAALPAHSQERLQLDYHAEHGEANLQTAKGHCSHRRLTGQRRTSSAEDVPNGCRCEVEWCSAAGPSMTGAAAMVPELAASANASPGVRILVLGQRVVPQPGAEQRDDLKAPGQDDQDAGLALRVPHHFVVVAQAVAGHIRKEDDVCAIACRKALDIPGGVRWREAESGSAEHAQPQHSLQMRGMALCAVRQWCTRGAHGAVHGHAVVHIRCLPLPGWLQPPTMEPPATRVVVTTHQSHLEPVVPMKGRAHPGLIPSDQAPHYECKRACLVSVQLASTHQ